MFIFQWVKHLIVQCLWFGIILKLEEKSYIWTGQSETADVFWSHDVHMDTQGDKCVAMYPFRHSDADRPVEKDAGGEAYHSGRVIQYCN